MRCLIVSLFTWHIYIQIYSSASSSNLLTQPSLFVFLPAHCALFCHCSAAGSYTPIWLVRDCWLAALLLSLLSFVFFCRLSTPFLCLLPFIHCLYFGFVLPLFSFLSSAALFPRPSAPSSLSYSLSSVRPLSSTPLPINTLMAARRFYPTLTFRLFLRLFVCCLSVRLPASFASLRALHVDYSVFFLCFCVGTFARMPLPLGACNLFFLNHFGFLFSFLLFISCVLLFSSFVFFLFVCHFMCVVGCAIFYLPDAFHWSSAQIPSILFISFHVQRDYCLVSQFSLECFVFYCSLFPFL